LILLSAWILLMLMRSGIAQELEPRRWSHLPVGANFVGVGYIYSDVDIFFDPAVDIEDATAEINTVAVSYVRALDVFGKSGRVDVVLPYSSGRWEGLQGGEPASARRRGFNDPKFRFAVNLYGSPAQRGAEFRQFKTNTIIGVALEVSAPFGEYQEDKLINLGKNRWTFRPQLGIVHNWDKWAAELTASASFFTDNDEFLDDKSREFDPLYALQGHLIYTFRPGLWSSFSAAYGNGAQSDIDGTTQNDLVDKLLLALSVGLPINARQGVKITYIRGETREDNGDDYNRLAFAYSMMWGGN